VEEYAGLKGSVPPVKHLKGKNTLFICTIEKANSLMNSLIEAGRLSEVGMVVADELHMIGDGPRGAIYEMILSKAKFCGRKSDLQIVATTATLENKKVSTGKIYTEYLATSGAIFEGANKNRFFFNLLYF